MRVWLCAVRLRYGRIMREDRTGQGYCQPDGRHSADPRVPFVLPATSKLLENPPLRTRTPNSISRHGSNPRVLLAGIAGIAGPSICENILTDPSVFLLPFRFRCRLNIKPIRHRLFLHFPLFLRFSLLVFVERSCYGRL